MFFQEKPDRCVKITSDAEDWEKHWTQTQLIKKKLEKYYQQLQEKGSLSPIYEWFKQTSVTLKNKKN